MHAFGCLYSEALDQPGYQPSQIRVFTVRMKQVGGGKLA